MSSIKSTSKISTHFNSCNQTHQLPAPSTCTDLSCKYYPAKSLVRPRFFAGQLLTEDDLSLLTFYTTEKNRMHNRYLFGDGVVCGLEVVCHPCGDGRVIVQPGYALDCCGNDMFVPCPIELDINAMVREFRIHRLGGYDCGDPCEDPKKPERRYCLYLRYCEQNTDPVAPYQTDEPCGNVDCEPTRIYEGYHFELDCEKIPQPKDDLASKMCECLGDPITLNRIMKDREILLKIIAGGQEAYNELMKNGQVTVSDDEISNFSIFQEIANDFPDPTNMTPDDFKKLADKNFLVKFNRVIPLVPKIIGSLKKLQIDRDRLKKVIADKKQKNAIELAIESINTKIRPIMKLLPPDVEENYTIFKSAILNVPEKTVQPLEKLNAITAEPKDILIAHGGLYIYGADYRAVYALLVRIQQFILCKLDQANFLTDCILRDVINDIKIPSYREGQVAEAATIPNLPSIAVSLVNALDRLFEDCFCHALNPPCTPCKDQRVLIACLEVKNCKVIEICNMKRNYVISPTAVRYWLPWISEIGKVMEKSCCESPLCQEEGEAVKEIEDWITKDHPPFLVSALSFIQKSSLSPKSLAKLLYLTICCGRMREKLTLSENGYIDPERLHQICHEINDLKSQIEILKAQAKSPPETVGKQNLSLTKADTKSPAKKQKPAKKT
jgi:hypothetical protein